jgi:proline dehydrogenase
MSAPTADHPRSAAAEIPERVLRAVFIGLSQRRSLGKLAVKVPVTRPMVRRFIAGESLDDVVPALARLSEAGYGTTVDVLGESVDSAEACGAAAARYEETLAALAGRNLDRNVSLKLTQMGLDIGHDLCRETVARVFRKAAEVGAFVRVDMEDHPKTDATLGIWRELRSVNPNSGVVIQAALKRSGADVEALIGEGARIRLCKGAYNEPAAIAFRERDDVSRAYEELGQRLLVADVHPAFATHDGKLIGRLIRFAREHGIPADRYEFQMLYGIRRDLQTQLIARGLHVRIYVPYGTEWYPYFMRRLAEKPGNVTFMLRSLSKEGMGPR